MPGIDRDLLNLKIKKANMTNDSVAKELGEDRSTFYRHLREGSLTVAEMHDLIRVLGLTLDDAVKIFLSPLVA
jgi:hypothetical protein